MIGPAVLYVPASNVRALKKAPTLGADAVIYDLEDAVAPAARPDAREALRDALGGTRPAATAVRVNHPSSPDFTEDLLIARAAMPDAVVVPKVESGADLALVEEALEQSDAPPTLALWAMIETPRGVLDAGTVAASGGRLTTLVVGTNDLEAGTGASRDAMRPWLMQILLAARACGLQAFDGVFNAISDSERFERECRDGATMGFDGKTLIHPSQIERCREAFRPTDREVQRARAIVAAFEREPGAGVLAVDGEMVERLHLLAARRALQRVGTHR